MPRRVTFREQDIVDAAFETVRARGLAGLSARTVAARLGSSTAPVYQQFASMSVLQDRVVERARDLLVRYATTRHTDRPFLNMGVGVTKFARDEPMLFRAMFLETDRFRPAVDEFLVTLSRRMGDDGRFTHMSERGRDELLTRMAIFTHGLAAMICVGLIADHSDEFITNTLIDMGGIVISASLTEESKRVTKGR